MTEMLDALAIARPRPSALLPVEFCRQLADVRPPLSALLISTRTLDLAAACATAGVAWATIADESITQIDVASPDLSRYFEPAV